MSAQVGPTATTAPASSPPTSVRGTRPIRRAATANFLHVNPYPNTASPGQHPRECEAGNEKYITSKVVIGKPAGLQ